MTGVDELEQLAREQRFPAGKGSLGAGKTENLMCVTKEKGFSGAGAGA